MKVLQINAVNAIASTGRNATELSEYLFLNKQECIVAYSKGPSVNSKFEYKIGSNLDTKLHGLLSRISGKQGYFSKTATKKLLDYMNVYCPDVVVLNNLHGNFINLPMLLKYLAKRDIPTAAVLHDCWFYTGKCCHYTTQGCFKWQATCGKCPQLNKYNKSWFFDKTTKLHKDKIKLFGNIPRLAVVGVSDWILNEAKQAPVFKNARIFKKIYNWIDVEAFSPKNADDIKAALGLENKKIVLSVASTWCKDKGIDVVFEIAKRLEDNVRYLIVGNIGDIKLPDNIIHIPATKSVLELSEYYSLADVFVQPSLEESFGKVCAESLACGTPVVCFDSTANPELVDEGCGAVVPKTDTNKMCAEIERILNNDKPTYSCRNSAINKFEKNKNLEEYYKLLKEISGDN